MTDNLLNWIQDYLDQLIEEKAYLSDLDQVIGDGDHGHNMARGANAMRDLLSDNEIDSDGELFQKLAMTFMSKVGGASGPLYGTAFLKMGQYFGNNTDDSVNWAKAFDTGLQGLILRGKAHPGEKTMVDIWDFVVNQLNSEAGLTEGNLDAFLETSKAYKATKGRASYYGDKSIGQLDPGTLSSYYFFQLFLKYFHKE